MEMVETHNLDAEIQLHRGWKNAREAFATLQTYLSTDFENTPLEEAVQGVVEAKASLARVEEIKEWYKKFRKDADQFIRAETDKGLETACGLDGKVEREAKKLFGRVKSDFTAHYRHFADQAQGERQADCRQQLATNSELYQQLAQPFGFRDGLIRRYYLFSTEARQIDEQLATAKAEYAASQFTQHALLVLKERAQGIIDAYAATTAAYKPFSILPRKTPFEYGEKVAEARTLAEEISAALTGFPAYKQLLGALKVLAVEPGSAEVLQQMQRRAAQHRAEAAALAQSIPNNKEASTTLRGIISSLYNKERQYNAIMHDYQQLSADCCELERIAGSAAKLAEAAQKRDVADEAGQMRTQIDIYAVKTYAPARLNRALLDRKAGIIASTQQYLKEAEAYMQSRAEEQKRREEEKAQAVAEAESIVRQHGTFSQFLSSLKPRSPAHYGLLETLSDPTRSWTECLETLNSKIAVMQPAACQEDMSFAEHLSRGIKAASQDTSYSYMAQKVSESRRCRAAAENAIAALAQYALASKAPARQMPIAA